MILVDSIVAESFVITAVACTFQTKRVVVSQRNELGLQFEKIEKKWWLEFFAQNTESTSSTPVTRFTEFWRERAEDWTDTVDF